MGVCVTTSHQRHSQASRKGLRCGATERTRRSARATPTWRTGGSRMISFLPPLPQRRREAFSLVVVGSTAGATPEIFEDSTTDSVGQAFLLKRQTCTLVFTLSSLHFDLKLQILQPRGSPSSARPLASPVPFFQKNEPKRTLATTTVRSRRRRRDLRRIVRAVRSVAGLRRSRRPRGPRRRRRRSDLSSRVRRVVVAVGVDASSASPRRRAASARNEDCFSCALRGRRSSSLVPRTTRCRRDARPTVDRRRRRDDLAGREHGGLSSYE